MKTLFSIIIWLLIFGAVYYFSKINSSKGKVRRFGNGRIESFYDDLIRDIECVYPGVKAFTTSDTFIQLVEKDGDDYVDFQIQLFGDETQIKFSSIENGKAISKQWTLVTDAGVLLKERMRFLDELRELRKSIK